ncbi:hypothetical protein C7G84_19280 [Acinetobacter baumannii]|nr:hypothetical protein C7G84_19280 [Acinetobacter baumannii]
MEAATFEITNQCTDTVWAAALPGGGSQLTKGQSWSIQVPAGTKSGRIWGRTGCSFDGNGRGTCQTGDCNGMLSCQASGQVPTTLAEYTLNGDGNKDFYDISLVDGFNLPLSITPSTSGFQKIGCLSDINSVCPNEPKVAGGCKSACAAYNKPEYCCTGAFNTRETCPPTNFSKIFKDKCPQAYSYAYDDPSSTFTCPAGSDYKIVFCG